MLNRPLVEEMAMPLAIENYSGMSVLADTPSMLNLAWTLDEVELLQPPLGDALGAQLQEAWLALTTYHVQDPYGERQLTPAVASFLGTDLGRHCIVCGAGVNSLLHALARWGAGKNVYVLGETYPDFPAWVERLGGRCIARAPTPEAAADIDGELVFVERPSLVGDELGELSVLATVCEALRRRGALVVVDESNANYYPTTFSAVHLIERCENLVVIRGMSKAYGLGGLRIGYVVAADALRARLHSVVPPLLGASLSLALAARVLRLGDMAPALREQIVCSKRLLLDRFRAAGLRAPIAASHYLPYVLLHADAAYVESNIVKRGILGKFHPVWSGAATEMKRFYRLSAPLSRPRIERLCTSLEQVQA
jgi:histidinol-phosphate/aromatic aminotransferase/cobyric acid decarboxylase-like protein